MKKQKSRLKEECIVSLRSLFINSGQHMDIDDFIGQIEILYKGLGIPVLYGVLSILANKSVFFIAGRGVGKTRLIKCIPDVPGVKTSNWDTFTLGGLDTLCRESAGPTNLVFDEHFVFKVEEFSTLSEYHRNVFLSVCSKICSDGNYRHVTSMFPNLHFEDCKLTMLIAIQPKLYSLLCHRYTVWESMSYDRFTKFMLLNPLRRENTVDTALIPTLPREIPPSATIPRNLDLSELNSLFRGHVSEGRAQLYSKHYASALARFLGRNEVEQHDVDTFHKLFSPYLEPFSRLQYRPSLDFPIVVSSGHIELLVTIGRYSEGVSTQQLSESLKVTPDHIERCARFLLERGLTRREERNYHLSDQLERFFTWYDGRFSC